MAVPSTAFVYPITCILFLLSKSLKCLYLPLLSCRSRQSSRQMCLPDSFLPCSLMKENRTGRSNQAKSSPRPCFPCYCIRLLCSSSKRLRNTAGNLDEDICLIARALKQMSANRREKMMNYLKKTFKKEFQIAENNKGGNNQ